MITTAAHYSSIVLLIALPLFATALGQARIGKAACTALDIQPGNDSGIKKIFFAGLAIAETVALIAILMGIYLFNAPLATLYQIYARIGAWLAVTVPAILIGYFGSLSVQQALLASARQPFLSTQILNFVLVTQSLMQTPVIFSAIFAYLIQTQTASIETLPQSLQLLATGLTLALCSIGPSIGLSSFIAQACDSLKINRAAYGKLFSFTFISQAIIETPFLLGLAVAIVMLQLEVTTLTKALALLCAACAQGITAFVVSIMSARVSTRVLHGIAHAPEHAPLLGRLSLFCQVFIDTTAIYGLIIALLLITYV